MQSNRTRVLVAIGSVAAIVVLLIVFAGGSDDGGDETTVAQTTTTTTTESGTGEGAEQPEKPDKPDKPAVPTVVVKGGEPAGGVQELAFAKGEDVRFEVRSDTTDEIHVHGYDVYADVEAGAKTKVAFPADIDGVFEVEMHGSGQPIAQLTVKPS